MADLYKPREAGLRIPMPGRQPEWPADGQPVNFADTYQARLVASGDLVKIEDEQPEGTTGRKK